MSEAKTAVPFATSSPDPEVPVEDAAAQVRRVGRQADLILDEAERATGHGGIGFVLRREVDLSSTLHGAGANATLRRPKLFLRSEVRDRSAIHWPEKTKSCVARISVYKKSWRKRTSSSTFKKVAQLLGNPLAETPNGEKIMTALDQLRPLVGMVLSLPSAVGSTRNFGIVAQNIARILPAAPSSEKQQRHSARALSRWRTVHRAGLSS